MKQRDVFEFLKKGGATIAEVSQGLMKNPGFVAAVATAYRGRERLNTAVNDALKAMNIPTRSEFKRAVSRIEALERDLAESGRAPVSHAAPAPRPPAAPRPHAAPAPGPKRRPATRRKKAPPSGGA